MYLGEKVKDGSGEMEGFDEEKEDEDEGINMARGVSCPTNIMACLTSQIPTT